jgi:VWFA-related protein
MSSIYARRIAAVAILLAAIPVICLWAAPITRTVYVSVTDGKGAAVTDLTAANFKVKEGGKEREILKAEPAKTLPRLALMVEERLAIDQSVRVGLFEFVKRLNGAAEISLITVGLRNTTAAPFTTNANVVLKAINELSLNAQPSSNLTECINDMAKIFEQEHPDRPVMVVVAYAGGQAGGASASSILTQLRQSGAAMYAVTFGSAGGAETTNPQLGTMGDESGREQVLGDGSKQSGGRRFDVVSTGAIPKALQQIADDLTSQYAISYALPDGVKPDKRFSISTDRKGVSVRAPSAIPDK